MGKVWQTQKLVKKYNHQRMENHKGTAIHEGPILKKVLINLAKAGVCA
jgi:hypothetical protein